MNIAVLPNDELECNSAMWTPENMAEESSQTAFELENSSREGESIVVKIPSPTPVSPKSTISNLTTIRQTLRRFGEEPFDNRKDSGRKAWKESFQNRYWWVEHSNEARGVRQELKQVKEVKQRKGVVLSSHRLLPIDNSLGASHPSSCGDPSTNGLTDRNFPHSASGPTGSPFRKEYRRSVVHKQSRADTAKQYTASAWEASTSYRHPSPELTLQTQLATTWTIWGMSSSSHAMAAYA